MARAALRHLDLPDGPPRSAPHARLRLLVDHREDLVAERTRCINRLRWHLHELDPAWDPGARSLTRYVRIEGMVARVALEVARRVREISEQEKGLEREISALVADLAPHLLALPGVGALGAAKIAAEVADVRRFKSKDAFARHNGTAPLPVWSGNRERHRLSRTGNRQLNAVIHRMAITQARCHEDAAVFLKRREAMGNTSTEARRVLKRRLSDVVFRTLLLDAQPATPTCLETAA